MALYWTCYICRKSLEKNETFYCVNLSKYMGDGTAQQLRTTKGNKNFLGMAFCASCWEECAGKAHSYDLKDIDIE